MYFAFEESPAQLLRNMRSIGIDLAPYAKKGVLHIEATRPSLFGLEMHLATKFKVISDFNPLVVVVDPITDFVALGTAHEVRSMMTRLVDHLKAHNITALMTSLSSSRTVRRGGRRHLLAHRHLDPQPAHRGGGRAQPRHQRAQVARHGALAPDPRIHPGG